MQVSNRVNVLASTRVASNQGNAEHHARPLGTVLKYTAGGLGLLSLGSAGIGFKYARWIERAPRGYDPMSSALIGMLTGGAAFVAAGGLGALAAGTFGIGLLTD